MRSSYTLTQGYWKTDLNCGPAPLDPTWDPLPASQEGRVLPNVDAKGDPGTGTRSSGPRAILYDHRAPVHGSDAEHRDRASTTAAVAVAEGFFASFTPAEAGALGKTSSARTNALGWASTLGSYNEGSIGPGHCDE